MRKQLQALSLAILSTFAGLSSLSVSAQESTILYEQSFDDPTQFEEAAALPRGGLRKELLHFLLSLRRIMEGLPILASI